MDSTGRLVDMHATKITTTSSSAVVAPTTAPTTVLGGSAASSSTHKSRTIAARYFSGTIEIRHYAT
jgi:hypothetical protein